MLLTLQAFYNCNSLTDVYYSGTNDEWGRVSVNMFNYSLGNASMHYSHTHVFGNEEIVLPTCTEMGLTTSFCECGACDVVYIDALGHDYQHGVCDRCGETSEDVIKTGVCGDDLKWTLFEDGLLTIYGTGAMNEYGYLLAPAGYRSSTLAPWGGNMRNSITAVVIESGVTSISGHAFMDCENIKSVIIPDTITAIPGDTFRYCDSLTKIDIPSSVTTIGTYAFLESGLEEIVIPDTLTTINDGAFKDCVNLKTVHFNGTESDWNAITKGNRNEALTNATIHYLQ